MQWIASFHRIGGKLFLGLLLLYIPWISAGCGVEMASLDLGVPAVALHSPVIGSLSDNTPMHVGITFKVSQSLLNSLDHQNHQTSQPSHLEQFANKLGISDETYQKFKDFFNLAGLKLQLSKLHTHLAVNGKASLFAKVFSTHFVQHTFQGRTFFAPDKAPQVPRFLADSIEAVTGLDNYSSPPQHTVTPLTPALSGQHTNQAAPDCSPPGSVLLPKEVAGAYGFEQLWNRGWHGENMTVNLVEIDGFYDADLQNYLDCINFQGHIKVVDIDNSPTEAAGESTLDLEMIAGLARSINIVDYETGVVSDYDAWTQINDELQQIIDDNVNNANKGGVVSISLGINEFRMSASDVRAINQSLQVLTQVEHMRVFVASGDCGAFASGVYHDLSVAFPASDPWATAVGGTVLHITGNGQRASEVVWSDDANHSRCGNRWGSGGGESQLYARLPWQQGSNHRHIPDVSAAAFNLAVYFNGEWVPVGGTSAAAPIWATGMALVNQGLISQLHTFTAAPQLFYDVANGRGGPSAYFDVTQGDNLYYPAHPGWDYSTGLGSPNLGSFYQVLSNQLRS